MSSLLVILLTTCLTLLLAAAMSFPRPRRRTKNMYSLAHRALNYPSSSMWMNMGYWSPQAHSTLPMAARALLLELLHHARILPFATSPKRRLRILDVGCGCGDSGLALAQILGPALTTYLGVTNERTQAEYASARLREYTELVSDAPAKFEAVCADAGNPASFAAYLPSPTSSRTKKDEVEEEGWCIALDSAYHFSPSRGALLNFAREQGMSWGAFDLLLSPHASVVQRLLLRLICPALGTPYSNLLSEDEYIRMLVRAGFEPSTIRLRDVSEHVFAELVGFLDRQDRVLRQAGRGGLPLPFQVAGWLFAWWARSGVVRGYFVVARCRPERAGEAEDGVAEADRAAAEARRVQVWDECCVKRVATDAET